MEYKDPGRYIPIIFLLYCWGSLFGVPSKVPLSQTGPQSKARVSLDVELLGPGFAYWLLVGKMGIYLHNPLHDVISIIPKIICSLMPCSEPVSLALGQLDFLGWLPQSISVGKRQAPP